MTGINLEFCVGKSKMFFIDNYIDKRKAMNLARRYVNSKLYYDKDVPYFKIEKKEGVLKVLTNKDYIVFPRRLK